MNVYQALRITLQHVIDQIVSGKVRPYQRLSLGGADLLMVTIADPYVGETLSKCGGAFASVRGLDRDCDAFAEAHDLGDRPFIVVSTTFTTMDINTIMFVIAHEYAHVHLGHLKKISHLAYQRDKIEKFFCDPSNTFEIEADAFGAKVTDKQTGYQLLDRVYQFLTRESNRDFDGLLKLFDGKRDLLQGSIQSLNNRLAHLQ